MSGYEITFSITAVCPCCGDDLPFSAYLTVPKASKGPLDRDNPYERKDRRVFISPCTKCYSPKRTHGPELMKMLDGKDGRASIDEVRAWAERHDITGQYLVAAYEDAAASQLSAGVSDDDFIDSVVDSFMGAYGSVPTRACDIETARERMRAALNDASSITPKPDNKESR